MFSGFRFSGFVFSALRVTVGIIALATATACGSSDDGASRDRPDTTSAHDSSITAVDDGGRSITLKGPARRIISLIPSATETVMALGATDRIVGRTRYDVDPAIAQVASVGGGLDPSIEAVIAQHPDLVLAWENDKRRDVPNKLASLGIPVFTLRTEDTTDVFRNIANLGKLMARNAAADSLARALRTELDDIRHSVADAPRPTVLYVVSNNPPMTAGPQTFIAQLISVAGARSIFDDVAALWPTVSMEEIVRRSPDVIVLPQGEFRTNGVATMRARSGWRDVPAVRENHIVTVDANLMNRPGPRIAEAARALRDALHPDLATARARP